MTKINRRDFLKGAGGVLSSASILGALSSISCDNKWKDMNVLFVSLDTLRGDHCGFLGYKRKTTPFLDDFSRNAAIFERMHTHSPWTDQSHASIFSSLYPRVHSISFKTNNYLRFSIASILKERGFNTAGFVETISLDSRIGVATGFDTYMNVEYPKQYEPNRAPNNNKRVFEWLKGNHKSKFFLFVHYFDIHYPYNPPGDYRHTFHKGEYRKDIKYFGANPWSTGNPTKEQLQQVIDLYDGEIAFTDHHLSNLINKLDEYRLLDRTIIVIFSDHGEGFYEHGQMNHGNSLYQELLRIPTIIKFPDGFGSGRRISGITRSIDITPTVLDYLGVEREKSMQGMSLLDMIENNRRKDLLFFADGIRYAMCFREKNWKLIYNHQMTDEIVKKYNFTAPRPEFELYNLANDPKEQKNLALEEPGRVARAYEMIKKFFDLNQNWKRGFIMGQKKALDKDLEEGLRQLGYIQ